MSTPKKTMRRSTRGLLVLLTMPHSLPELKAAPANL